MSQGGPIPPKVIVDGTALTTTAVQPEQIDGEWYLPVAPIAQLLQYRLDYDPLSLLMTLEDPIAGRTLRYDGITGEVTDNDVAQMFLAPGLALGSDVEDVRLPVSLVAALLDMEVWVSPNREQISLTRRGAQYRTHRNTLRPFRMRELKYQGNGSRVGAQDGADLLLNGIGDLRNGDLRADASFRGSSQSSVQLRTASASYWNGSNRRITGGDLYGSTDLSWQRASGRGISWQEEVGSGKSRLAFSALRLLSGSSGDIARGSPIYDRHAISASVSMGARPGAPRGASLAFGTSWLEGTTEQSAGALLALEGRWTRPGARVESRIGSFVESKSADRLSWDVQGDYSPWKPLRLRARAFDFSRDFQVPNNTFAGESRQLYSYGGSYYPVRSLHIQGSQVRQRRDSALVSDDDPFDTDADIDEMGDGFPLDPDDSAPSDSDSQEADPDSNGTDSESDPDAESSNGTESNTGPQIGSRDSAEWETHSTFGLGFRSRYSTLRSVHTTATIPHENKHTGEWQLLTAARGHILGSDWFGHSRREMGANQETRHALTGGLSRVVPHVGQLRLTGNWYGGVHQGGSILWTPRALWQGRLLLTLGQRWQRSAGSTDWRALGRVRWQFLPSHGIDLSVQERRHGDPSIRLSLSGGWSFRKSSSRKNSHVPRALRHVGELDGRVYLDRNLNGVFDEEDQPVRGVTVLLDGGKYQTQTKADGTYSFGEVDAGKHQVALLGRSVRADLVLLDKRSRAITLASFEHSSTDFRLGLNRTIRGQAYFDRNENGTFDADDAPAYDVRLLVNGRQDTMTRSDGTFLLGDVPPGVQTLIVDPSSIPRDFVPPRSIEVDIPSEIDPDQVWIPIRPKPKTIIRKSFSSRLGSK